MSVPRLASIYQHPSAIARLACVTCGQPRALHYDSSGCILLGCPVTTLSIQKAIDGANQERADMRAHGIAVEDQPYPEARQ